MEDLDRPPGAARRGNGFARWEVLGLAALLALYLGLAWTSAQRKSVTVDELGHLPSGFYYLTTGDPRYCSLNPPLVNVLSALPVLLLDLPPEPAPPEASADPFSFWSAGYAFLEDHRADYRRIYAAARWMPILTGAGLAILLFCWGRRLSPETPAIAGLLAAGSVCLSPNVIAQARIVGTDVGTAFFVALAVFVFRAMLARPTPARALLCGLALGLAQLTKFYALLLYPTLLGLTLAWPLLSRRSGVASPRAGRLLGASAVAFALSLLVIHAGYLGRGLAPSLADLPLQSSVLEAWQSSALGELPIPLPAGYLRAFDAQLFELDSKIPAFLFGERFEGGRWYYYLAVLTIKTPIPLLLLFGLALVLSLPRPPVPPRELALLLTYPLLLFVLLSLSDRRQLGARALLSAVPFVQLWVAATIARSTRWRWGRVAAAGALAWLAALSIWTHPNYLSYFNAFAGGSERGYRYASDANVDIGQDLVLLAEHLEDQGEKEVQLLYFGSVDPAVYGIDYVVPGDSLAPGLFAVSVSLYRMSYPTFDHGVLRVVGPVSAKGLGEPVSIGGSIHVYRIPD